MGLDKYTHLKKLVKNDSLTSKLYPQLIEEMKKTIEEYSHPVNGINKVFAYLLKNQYYIGSTSGYSKNLLDIAATSANSKGMYIPYYVATDQVQNGRPYSDMILKNINYFNLLDEYHKKQLKIVKIGDTVVDVLEGYSVKAKNISICSNDSVLEKKLRSAGSDVILSDVCDVVKYL